MSAQIRENPMDSSYADREFARSAAFERIWTEVINDVFADVAKYYDRANVFATLGLIDPLRRRFIATMDVRPHDRVLDVCAGTNVIVIDLLKREPTLEVHAIDRSAAIQEVGDGKGTLGKLLKDEKLYGELTKALGQVNGLVQDVQEGKGSLGKLMNNTELYLEAVKSLKDLQSTMTSFKQNADAIKSLPLIKSYVVDINKELNRPGAQRLRKGVLDEKEVDKYLKELPDAAANAETVTTPQPALVGGSPSTPPSSGSGTPPANP